MTTQRGRCQKVSTRVGSSRSRLGRPAKRWWLAYQELGRKQRWREDWLVVETGVEVEVGVVVGVVVEVGVVSPQLDCKLGLRT